MMADFTIVRQNWWATFFLKITIGAVFSAQESPMKLNAMYDACGIKKVQPPSSMWVVPVIKRYASV